MPEGPGRIEMLLNAAPSAPPHTDAGPQVFVNGQPVTQLASAGPEDFALDVAPNGSSTVGPLPQPKAQPTAPPTPPSSHQPEPPKGSTASPPHAGAPKHSGSAPPGQREGVPPVQPQPHSHTPHPPAHSAHPGGQEIVGHGKHAARVDLTDKMHPPLHYVAHKNPDGSLDVTFPKGHGNAHEIRVHVPAGKNLDMNVSRDAHGHIHVQSHPATPAAHKSPVLAPPDGKAPKSSNTPPPNTSPVGSIPAPGSTAPGADPGSSSPASPSIPTPAVPSAPSSPGDSGPGGSAAPGPAGQAPAQPPAQPADPANPGNPHAVTVSREALVNFTGAISSTADDVQKAQQAADINLGFPGPGVAGIPVSMAHSGVKDAGIQQVTSTHTGLSSWVTALKAVTQNWQDSDQKTQDFANKIHIIAPPSI